MIIFSLLAASCVNFGPYPEAPVSKHTEEIHSVQVADPYRYMENPNDSRRVEWLRKELNYSADYFKQIKTHAEIKHELREMIDYQRFGSFMRLSRRYIYLENTGLQNQPTLMIQNGLKGSPRILLDPNSLSSDGTVALQQVVPSFNNNALVYTLARKGADAEEIHILDLRSGKKLKDVIKGVKYSNVAWYGKGFFYSAFDKENKHTLYYHKLKTLQKNDERILQDQSESQVLFSPYTSEEQKYLLVFEQERGSTGTAVHYMSLKTPEKGFQTLVKDFSHEHTPIDINGDLLYMIQDASLYSFNLKTKMRKLILSSKEKVIENAVLVNNTLVVQTIENAANALYVYSLTGKQIKQIPLPSHGTITSLFSRQGYHQFYYSFSSLTEPSTLLRYDLKRDKMYKFKKSIPEIDLSEYTSELHMVPSTDGVQIPMHLVYKKGLKFDGKAPTILYGYGGFNVPLLPRYHAAMYYLLERDGVFAQAAIRGGGEFGKKWHQAGMGLNKNKCFEDFAACAKYLSKNKITSPEKLGLQGGSNGGLLVGAMTIRYPELFQVGLIHVGVLDMLRFQEHTIGWAWEGEYGSIKNRNDFLNLMKISPYRNVKQGVDYPATLVLTADHDDRVVPFHSFKFLAELQAKGGRRNPYLLRLDTKAGHGAGKPLSKVIDEYADVFAFFLCNTGEIKLPKPAPHK